MEGPFKQADRAGRLFTDLGDNVLVLLGFSGTEPLNAPFDYAVECITAEKDIAFDDLLGTHATVEIDSHDVTAECFDGLVTEVNWLGAEGHGNRYRLRLQPWTFLATLRRNQRIFHNKTAPMIIEEVLRDHAQGGTVENRLSASYPELEYTVQYRESDFDFVCRMMERFGISWHFEHGMQAHRLVLTDLADDHRDIGGRPLRREGGERHSEQGHFWKWEPSRRITTGQIRLVDFNFKTPDAAMETEMAAGAEHMFGAIESFDWPGDYLDDGQGKRVAALRADQERGQGARFVAEGNIPALRAGAVVKLAGEKVPGHGDRFVCLVARHVYSSNGYSTGGGDEDSYEASYVMMPATAPLAPERKTRPALITGPQTAKVVGKGEIDCDEYGRILVRFHWDLADKYSMRCRVSQNWAGKGWGGMVIPRIGMEVLVEFLDGDPDKPLVTGCVYNGKNEPPYELPANKTKSVFRTDTHQGTGFNELSFEDEKGREKIYVHAQRDHEIHVEHDRSKRVDRNQLESIGSNKTIEVGNNHHEVIGGNMTLLVGPNKLQRFVTDKFKALTAKLGDMAEKLGLPEVLNMGEGNLFIGVAKNKAETVMLSSTEVVGAGKAVTVGGGFQTVVGGIANTSVGIGSYEEVGQNKALIVGKQYEIVVGEAKLLMQEDGTISISGKKILIDGKDLVHITGEMVKIN